MATAKQLAALKKARAARKRNLAKKKKPVAKRKTTTRKTTRKANPKKRVVKKPRVGHLMALVNSQKKVKAYWTGRSWDTAKSEAKWYSTVAALKKGLTSARNVQKKLSLSYRNLGIAAIPAKK